MGASFLLMDDPSLGSRSRSTSHHFVTIGSNAAPTGDSRKRKAFNQSSGALENQLSWIKVLLELRSSSHWKMSTVRPSSPSEQNALSFVGSRESRSPMPRRTEVRGKVQEAEGEHSVWILDPGAPAAELKVLFRSSYQNRSLTLA